MQSILYPISNGAFDDFKKKIFWIDDRLLLDSENTVKSFLNSKRERT